MRCQFTSSSKTQSVKLASLILFTQMVVINTNACEVTKLTGSTSKVIIMPSENKVYSNLPSEGISISRCKSGISRIFLTKNTVFQYLNSRAQSVSKIEDLNTSQKCEIKNDNTNVQLGDLKQVLQNNIKDDFNTLQQCVLFEVSSPFKKAVKFSPSAECEHVSSSADSSQIVLKGNRCVINYSAQDFINVKFKIADQCKTLEFMKSFEAKDVLSQFIVHAAMVDKSKSVDGHEAVVGDSGGPAMSRAVVFKFLPDQQNFPTSRDEVTKINYPSVLNYSFHQGQITMREFGQKTRFDFEFLTENISKSFCKNGFCTKGSNSFNPVMIKMNVYRKNDSNYEILNAQPWYAPVVIPKNWSGILEASDRSLFLGNVSSIYNINQSLKKGDKLKLVAEFMDAKNILQELMMDQELNADLNSDNYDITSEETLPRLPQFGIPKLQLKLIELPSLLSDRASLYKELEDFGIDMNSVFTHTFSKICNKDNRCARIEQGQSFQKIETYFEIAGNEYGLSKIENVQTVNTSAVYPKYEATLKQLPKIECQ